MPALRTYGMAALLAGWLAMAGDASAAENRKRTGRYRLGPLHLTPRVQLKNAGVDTNVFQTRHDPTRDHLVVVSPRADAFLPVGRRLRFTALTFAEVTYFRRQGDERSTDFYGQARAELLLRPATFYAAGGGGRFTQRFSIDVDERLKRDEYHVLTGTTLRIGRRLSLTGEVRREVVTFAPGVFRLGGDVKQALDRETLSGSGQLRIALTNRTSVLLSSDVLEDRFFSEPAIIRRTRRSYRHQGGFELSERAVVSGKLLAGLRVFPGSPDQSSPSYRGPMFTSDLTLPIGQRARVRAVLERDVLFASSLVEVGTLRYRNAFVYTRLQGETLLDLPLRLIGQAGFGFEQARYLLPYPYLSPTFLSDRLDHRWTASASLLRRLGDSLRVGGHVSWARRVSSLPLFSYQGLRYGLTAEIAP